MTLKGNVAVITGASRGLGRAIALSLGKAGASVAITDLLIENDAADAAAISRYSVLAVHFSQTGGVKTLQTSVFL